MKKIISIVLLFCFVTSFSSSYVYDAQSLNNEFVDLDKVEEQYFAHKQNGTTQEYKLEFEEGPIVSADPFGASQINEFYFDFEGFAWGFCCCPIGFFVIAINDNKDEDQKKSFWIGVVASAALSALGSLLSFASAATI